MNLYFSDREGKVLPPHCRFHIKPFSKPALSFSPHLVNLPNPASYKIIKRTFLPTQSEWKKNVQKALQLIEKNEMSKVVLGRLCILELQETPDPFAIAAALKEKAQGSFVFCAQLDAEESFLGASPERLFKCDQGHLFSEALAGTRPRGVNEMQDRFFCQELLKSAKDVKEFEYVQTYLKNTLSPFCTSLHFTPMAIHATSHVQHLYSQCSGALKPHIDDMQILSALHPTPALCGTPTDRAHQLIQELEPFDREFFGGCLGWRAPEASEWIVGIRSCHLKGKTATLFSGAGIVEGSEPDKEWEELNHKLRLYDRILVD